MARCRPSGARGNEPVIHSLTPQYEKEHTMTIDELTNTLFDLLQEDVGGERDGDELVISSGYGSGPVVIHVRQIAKRLADASEAR
jgi:hypothetical protein